MSGILILTPAVAIGLASFSLMPQSPAKTKSWWNPKGYFTPKEEKIIVNLGKLIHETKIPKHPHFISHSPGTTRKRGGCTTDKASPWGRSGSAPRTTYDMWPLYAPGLLFGIPKYPVNQYLTLSFRALGFDVIRTNLLSIPNIVGSSVMMLLITAPSELVENRSFVSVAEDAWLVPCFAALLALPDPIDPWAYFAIATVLLSFPW